MNSYNAAICSKVMDNKIHLQRTLEHGTNTLYSGYASGGIFHSQQFHKTYIFFLLTASIWQFTIKTWNRVFGIFTIASIYTPTTYISTSESYIKPPHPPPKTQNLLEGQCDSLFFVIFMVRDRTA